MTILVMQHSYERRSRSRIGGKWTTKEIKLRNEASSHRPTHSESARERAPRLRRRISRTGRKDDRNGGGGGERGTEEGKRRVADGGFGWLEAVTDTTDGRGGGEKEVEEKKDLRGWTCEGGDSFFRFYRKKRVALWARNGVQARIRRAHASRARGFSSHPRSIPDVSPPRFSLFFFSPLSPPVLPDLHLQVDRPRHWIPSYTNILLHKLHDQ